MGTILQQQHPRARRAARRLTAAAALLAAMTFAACGGDRLADKDSEQITEAAGAAVNRADSVRVVFKTSDGFGFDVRQVKGGGAVGTITEPLAKLDVVAADGMLYVKGDRRYYAAVVGSERDADRIGDRWLAIPGREFGAERYAWLSEMGALAGVVLRPEGGSFHKGDVTRVDGVEAIELEARDGSVRVSLDGEPYPLTASGKEIEELSFSEWNEPATVTAPKQSVELIELLEESDSASSAPTTPAEGRAAGLAGKSVDEIRAAALAAVERAGTVHVVASTGPGEGFDVHQVKGRGGIGTVRYDGVVMHSIVLDRTTYTRGDRSFWASVGATEAPVLRAIGDRWLETPTGGADVQQFGDMEEMFREMLDHDVARSATKGEVREVDGVRTIELQGEDGTVYVALEGTPYPVKLTGAPRNALDMSFTEWDRPVRLAAPKRTLTPAELQQLIYGG